MKDAASIYARIRAACADEHGLSSDVALEAHARAITLDVLRVFGLVRA